MLSGPPISHLGEDPLAESESPQTFLQLHDKGTVTRYICQQMLSVIDLCRAIKKLMFSKYVKKCLQGKLYETFGLWLLSSKCQMGAIE